MCGDTQCSSGVTQVVAIEHKHLASLEQILQVGPRELLNAEETQKTTQLSGDPQTVLNELFKHCGKDNVNWSHMSKVMRSPLQ